ncbi:zinc finger protein 385B [Anabrus simplex]|uniref:zinc finger protein 385B n=1 Tax=Anabrus simplex TaxID=316456 RepID=UPI0035A2FDFB
MSFYPAPTFPAVATMVNYRAAIPAAVPLSQPLVAPLPVPTVPAVAAVTTVLERKPCDGPLSSSFSNSDPVTKAVMDNIMGKLPTKKQAVTSKCDVCNLEFSGQVVLETHLAGAKHAKKVKSQEILKQLQSSGQTFTRDEKTRILKCEICDVVVNSSQQLQTHLAGGAADATTPGGAEVPAGVQKLPEGSGSKSNKYFCDTCSVSLNSEIQLEQHLGSRKHKDRLASGGKTKARPAPYWKKPRTNFQHGGGKPNKMPMMMQYSQPLSTNFVSGGAMI